MFHKMKILFVFITLNVIVLGRSDALEVEKRAGYGACQVYAGDLKDLVELKFNRISLELTKSQTEFTGKVDMDSTVTRSKEFDIIFDRELRFRINLDLIEIADIWYRKANSLGRALNINGPKMEITGLCYNKEYRILVVQLARELERHSKGKLGFTFTGSYEANGINRRTLAREPATQESFLARIFPGFDDPRCELVIEKGK